MLELLNSTVIKCVFIIGLAGRANDDAAEKTKETMKHFAALGIDYVQSLRKRANLHPDSRSRIAIELGKIIALDLSSNSIGSAGARLGGAQSIAITGLGKLGPESIPVIKTLLNQKNSWILANGLEAAHWRMMDSLVGAREFYLIALKHVNDKDESVRSNAKTVVDFYKLGSQ